MSVNLAIANIALDTAIVSRQGFGTILFVGQHNYFAERVRAYTSTKAMSEDGIDANHPIFKAAEGAFSQTPAPSSILIGRQVVDSVLSIDTAPVTGKEYSVTLSVQGSSATFTATAGGSDTAETIFDTLKAGIDGDTDIAAVVSATVVGTGSDATLVISSLNDGWFTLANLVSVEESFGTSTETAAEVVAAIEAEDDSWYYITAQEKSNTFVTDMADLIESKLKVYSVSLDELSVFDPVQTGTAVDLLDGNYFRTYQMYHQEAKTTFPEVSRVAEAAFAVTGSISYGNRRVAAVPVSLNAVGKPLTTTQQNKLKAINSDFFARVGSDASSDPIIGVVGKVASGEWLDNIVGRDNMQVDIEADFNTFLINQKNGKVAFNDKGINQIKNVLSTTLTQYTPDGTHNFIEDDFDITVADAADISTADKASRTFKQITFKATLTNAIHMVEITGTLSY